MYTVYIQAIGTLTFSLKLDLIHPPAYIYFFCFQGCWTQIYNSLNNSPIPITIHLDYSPQRYRFLLPGQRTSKVTFTVYNCIKSNRFSTTLKFFISLEEFHPQLIYIQSGHVFFLYLFLDVVKQVFMRLNINVPIKKRRKF